MPLPIILSKPESMFKARIVTIKDELDKVLTSLHASEALHVREIKELKPLEKEVIEKKKFELEELLKIVERFISYVKKEQLIVIKEEIEPYTIPELLIKYREPVKDLYSKLQTLAKRINELESNIENREEQRKYLELISDKHPDISLKDLNYEGDMLFSKTIVLSKEREEEFREKIGKLISSVVEEETPDMHEKVLVIVGLKRDLPRIKMFIRDLNIKLIEVPTVSETVSEYLKKLKKEIEEIRKKHDEISRSLEELIETNLKQAVILRIILENEIAKLMVLEKAVGAKYIAIIEGWIPESLREKLLYELHKNVKYFYVDFQKSEEREEPPTKMKNLKVLNFFEPLVKFYGIPKYKEWDPTPLVAYSFSAFFGIMLGDVIYGIFMLLVIRYVMDKLVENPESENYLLFKRMLYVAGFASIMGGIIFGSYMGNTLELLGFKIPPLAPQLTDPLSLILASMVIGLVHVNVAHVLAFIKALKEKDKVTIVSKLGLFLVEIFGIPYMLYKMVRFPVLPAPETFYNSLIYGVAVGIIFLAYSQILTMRFFGSFMWIFDITGLLGDIMSYTRIAGVAFATIYLASSFNLMASMVISGFNNLVPGIVGLILGGIFGAIVFGLGHLLNLALGIIGPFIHSLRLCFVEFLPKFYEGGGIEYTPLRLVLRRRVLIKPG